MSEEANNFIGALLMIPSFFVGMWFTEKMIDKFGGKKAIFIVGGLWLLMLAGLLLAKFKQNCIEANSATMGEKNNQTQYLFNPKKQQKK